MPLEAGTQLGSYEITSLLGKGGMGEVYRARDAKLKRDVAIKILPQEFSRDSERLSRFQREAEVLAALNHPHIGAIHDIQEANKTRFLVLELVEGETLADRLGRGPLPADEVLDISKQICEALEAAHERGIVHRDLKPANIKLTPVGNVKVLDFGLAKAFHGQQEKVDLSNSPTMASGSAAGVILGTAAYMSPEQARGKAVDRRADVWAFGCVLYEMLTGRQAFPVGETVSDTLAGVLAREPDWQGLPAGTPLKIRSVLERCLRKDERRRLRDIGDARIEIEEARNEPAAQAAAPTVALRSRWHGHKWPALALVFLLTTAGVVLRFALSPAPPPDTVSVQFEVFPPIGASLNPPGTPNAAVFIELSPDGRKLAFLASLDSKLQIWVRPLDSSTAQPLSSTEGLTPPTFFWSADSQYIGYIAQGKLNKVAATGGPSQVICSLPAGATYNGGTWNAEGVILLGRSNQGGPLLRVSAAGGELAPAAELDASRKETGHRNPRFLPDGRHYLYLAVSGGLERVGYVGTLDSKERHALPGIASGAQYSSSGRVVFHRDGSLMAQPFDLKRLELSGEAFPVAELGLPPAAVAGPYSVSMSGALAYRAGPFSANSQNSQLAWFDRRGKQLALVGPNAEYGATMSLSPDGQYVVFQRGAPPDIWVLDIQKGVAGRVVSHPASDSFPVWSPDGRMIAFMSNRDGAPNLYQRAFGVVGEDKLVLKSEQQLLPSDWSRDGRYLIFDVRNPGTPNIWALPLAGDSKPLRVTETSSFYTIAARISPDGRWIAYMSNESPGPRGSPQLFIQSFPQQGTKLQLSTNGAYMPRWSRDGKELFYVAPDLTLTAVSIKPTGSSLQVGSPIPLFKVPFDPNTLNVRRDYDVAPDGRFLINITTVAASPLPASPITVITNWAAGLAK